MGKKRGGGLHPQPLLRENLDVSKEVGKGLLCPCTRTLNEVPSSKVSENVFPFYIHINNDPRPVNLLLLSPHDTDPVRVLPFERRRWKEEELPSINWDHQSSGGTESTVKCPTFLVCTRIRGRGRSTPYDGLEDPNGCFNLKIILSLLKVELIR